MTEVLPLTPSQLHLWKSQVISAKSPLFNQAVTMQLDESFTKQTQFVTRMQAAWDRLLLLHPALCTVVIQNPSTGIPYQRQSETKPELTTVELNDEPAENWVCRQACLPLDLSTSLVQVALLDSDHEPTVLYVNLHHLVADAWSSQLICKNLIDEFWNPGSATGETASFRSYVTSITTDGDNNKPATTTPLSATALRPIFYGEQAGDPATQSSRHRVPLSATQQQQLAALNNDSRMQQLNQNLFQFSLHLCALAIYLHRTSGDHKITIDTPLLGRFDRQWMNTAGNFIEMGRLNINVEPEKSVVSLYQQCRNQLYVLLKSAEPGCTAKLPSGSVHGVLNMITAQETISGASLTWHHSGHSDTHHPLRLHIADWNASGMPSVEVDLNEAFFAKNKTSRVIQHLCTVYQAILENRDITVQAIKLTQADELWSFHGAQKKQQAYQSLPSLIIGILGTRPNAIAVSDSNSQLSNAQLLSLSGVVRENLIAAGIGKGHRVAVYLPRCLQIPAVLLGILRCGAAYVPIDCEQPSLRVKTILQDAQVACTITNTPENLENGKTISLQDAVRPLNGVKTEQDPEQEPDAEDAAYIIYTSGSTGQPKGVVISHQSLMAYLNWARGYYDLGEPLVMPLFSSLGFDLTVTSLYLPLLSGGHIRVFEQTSNLAAKESGSTLLLDVLNDKSVNTVKLTPAHLALLVEQSGSSASIKQLIVGGEDLKNQLATQTAARFTSGIRIVNEYGPTEATVGCIVRQWLQSNKHTGSVPIGLPISGMSAFVLDDNMQPQIEGVPGSLYLSGESLADGYWNAAQLSSQTFVQHPWQDDSKLYRTGDIVRVVAGELVYLGREDEQIKLNGYRIELGEIESTIQSHPSIDSCVAVISVSESTEITASDSSQRFCGLCGLDSLHPDAKLDENEVCSICRQYKPNHSSVDAYFKSIDELKQLINEIKSRQTQLLHNVKTSSHYDAIVLLSGGKDSTYSLCRLVDLGLNVCAFSLDNGYLSPQAKNNIDTVCKTLDVDHHYATTPHMNEIFVDSLNRYSNVCNGCFKTIYTLVLDFAAQHNIRTVFTGLSRGQLFETRLSNELFAEPDVSVTTIDAMVQAARLQYHAIDDGPNQLLNIRKVNDGTLVHQVAIVDFYRYCHVEMSDMLAYIKQRAGWIRPPDTGRSTNCLINDVGIHVHKLERGFHNYSLPYSWDVRLGHKKRDEALDELDDDIDIQNVDRILSEINYMPKSQAVSRLTIKACYTSKNDISSGEIEDWIKQRLPAYMLPQQYLPLKQLPINVHGKVDRKLLSSAPATLRQRKNGIPLTTDTERRLAEVWKAHITEIEVHADDNFFSLGGDSLSAIRCVMQLRRMGYSPQPADLFHHPRLGEFAALLEKDQKRAEHTDTQQGTPIEIKASAKFSNLDPVQRKKLMQLLNAEKN